MFQFSMQAAWWVFCLVKWFMLIPNHLFNQPLWILWPYYDKYDKFIVNILRKKKCAKCSLNLIHFCFDFPKKKKQGNFHHLLKFSKSLIVKKKCLLAKLLYPEKMSPWVQKGFFFIFGSKFKLHLSLYFLYVYPA